MVQMIFVLWKGKDVKKDSLARVGQSNRMKIFSFPSGVVLLISGHILTRIFHKGHGESLESVEDTPIRAGNCLQAYWRYVAIFKRMGVDSVRSRGRSLRLSAAGRSESTLTRSLAGSLTCEICGLNWTKD